MRRPFILLPFAAAFLSLLQTPAFAADFTVDNLDFLLLTNSGATTIEVPHATFVASTLTKEEARQLLSPLTSPAIRKELVLKLKATKIVIPELSIVSESATEKIVGWEADDVDAGRASRLSVQGGEAHLLKTDRLQLEMHFRPFTAEDIDVTQWLRSSEATPSADWFHFGHVFWAGLHGTATPTSGPAGEASKEGPWTIDLQSWASRASYKESEPVKRSSVLKHLTIQPPAYSKASVVMAAFGYKAIDLGAEGESTYDPLAQTLTLDHFKIEGDKMGALTLSATFGAFQRDKLKGAYNERLEYLRTTTLLALHAHVSDAGLFNNILTFLALTRSQSPAALREQWAASAALTLPVMLGGDPAALEVGRAVSAFIAHPKTLDVNVAAKGEPVRLDDLQAASRKGLSSFLRINAAAAP